MTDREAIRRLARIVSDHANGAIKSLTVCAADNLFDDLAEPAAPTVTRKFVEVPSDTPCGVCGKQVEPGSGAHFCRPTVTREMEETFAERVVQLIEENANDDLRDEMNRDQPAFFRAVADALDLPPKPKEPPYIVERSDGKVIGHVYADGRFVPAGKEGK